MPVMAKCRECGKQFRVRDELAGKVLPCKACGADFRVPSPGGRSPKPRPGPPPQRRRREEDLVEEDAPSGGGSATLWIVAGSAVGVIILGVAIAIFVFSGKGKSEDGGGNDNSDNVAQNDDNREPPNGDGDNPANNLPAGNNGNRGRINPGNDNPRNQLPDNNNPGGKRRVAKNAGGGIEPPAGGNNPPAGGNNNLPQPGGGVQQPGGLIPAGNGNKPAVDKSSAVQWTMKVDPPAEPIEYADKNKLTLRGPKTIWVNAVYPSSNSAFVAIGSNHDVKDYRDVYDLRTGREIGQVRGLSLGFARAAALSPVGSHFAAVTSKTNGILLWDVKNKRQLGTLPLDDKTARSGRPHILDFAGADRIVASGQETPLWVWTHPFDKPALTIQMPKWHEYDKESVTFSRGGKYMTFYQKRQKDIVAYDLSTGKEAGRIMIPKDISLSGCKGMAFSQDGKELAALFQFIRKTRLFVWDVATGKQLLHHQFELDRGHYKGPAIQWFPDKSKWLILGNHVVDRVAGKPLWQVPKIPDARDEARLLGGDRIALYGKSGRDGFISTLAVPHDELAKAAKVVQSGGTTADVNLPELKPANWNAARIIAGDGVAGGWTLAPDPAPGGELPGGAVNIDTGFGSVTGVAVARRDVGRAVTLSESSTTAAGRAGRAGRARAGRFGGQQQPMANNGPATRIDLYDLKNRTRADTLPINYKCDLMAVSPSGSYVLVRYKTGENRLDVWSLGEKKHIAGWKPYIDEKSKHHHKVDQALFVDEEYVLTINGNNRLAVWKLPEAKAVFVINGVKQPSVSSNGKYVAAVASKSFRFFDARTGEPAGDITLTEGSPLNGAFHPDGERFAGVFVTPGGMKVGTWDLKTGNLEAEFPIPRVANTGKLHWCGNGHLLLDNTRLVDLKSKMIVWSYSLPGGTHVDTSPDGKHWYLSGTRPMTLTGLTMPDATAKRQLDGKKLEPTFILKPGMEVALNIQLNNINGQGNLTGDVYNAWKQKLEAAGVKVVQKAPLVLFARATSSSTGKSKTYRRSRFGLPSRIGGGGAGETVSETVLNCRIVFGKNGKAYGERKRAVSNIGVSFTRLKRGDSLSAHLAKMQQRGAASFFKNYIPPGYLFEDGAAAGIGNSQLVSGGSR